MTHTQKTLFLTFMMAIIFVFSTGSSAFAQKEDKAKQKALPPFEQSKPYTKATKGAWKVDCYKTTFKSPEGKNTKEVENCVVLQDVISAKDKRVKSRISLMQGEVRGKDGKITIKEALRIAAPLGVLLPLGVAVEVDGKAIGRYQYLQCVPGTCLTQVDMDGKLKKQILASKEMKMLLSFPPNRNFPVKVNMKGLKDALAVRDKVHAANK